jgi:hypothetical protein
MAAAVIDFYDQPSPAGFTIVIRGRHRIDDLIIERIHPSELPDLGEYRAAVDSVPPERRGSGVELPGLVGADPGKSVTVDFIDP